MTPESNDTSNAPMHTGEPEEDRRPRRARRRRWLHIVTGVLSLLLLAAILVAPLVLDFEQLPRALYVVIGLGLLFVTLQAVSLLRLLSEPRDVAPPLRRDEAPQIDYDAPWHGEAPE